MKHMKPRNSLCSGNAAVINKQTNKKTEPFLNHKLQ